MGKDEFSSTRRTALKTVGGLLATGAISGVATADHDDNHIVPNGPWMTETQETKYNGFYDYEELVKRLEQIERSTQGRVSIDTIGQSNQGREIFLATVGTGETDVFVITQQHGNEPTGTEAVLTNLLSLLGNNGSVAQDILDELTVHVVPRVNVDGAEIPQRYNVDTDAPSRDTSEGFFTAWSDGVGWDINRYHDPAWEESRLYQNHPDEYPENPVPEAVAVQEAVNEVDPLWIADVHNQGTYKDDDGDMINSSIFWPIHEDVSEDVQNLSKQLCRVIYDHVQPFGYSNITQYPGGTYPGIARNGYGLRGIGSVLIEHRAGIGQKSQGSLNRMALEQLMSMFEATADRSLFEIEPDSAEEIPKRGDWHSKSLPPE